MSAQPIEQAEPLWAGKNGFSPRIAADPDTSNLYDGHNGWVRTSPLTEEAVGDQHADRLAGAIACGALLLMGVHYLTG
ncbi:MAG: hypothetical protein ACR2PZ_15395 [Pseudomonadales bacterium]